MKLEVIDIIYGYHHAEFQAKMCSSEFTMRIHEKEGGREKEGGKTVLHVLPSRPANSRKQGVLILILDPESDSDLRPSERSASVR